MSKHTTMRNNKRKPGAAKTRKHRKQSGGVIPDIKRHSKEEGLLLLKQSLSNFGMPDKRHPTVKDIRLQEQKDIEALNNIYLESYQHEQEAIKKILAESIYNNGKKGKFKYSADDLDPALWPLYAKSIEYKAFVDKLCFPKAAKPKSYPAPATPVSEQSGKMSTKSKKTPSEEALNESIALARKNGKTEENNEFKNDVKPRLAELNKSHTAKTERERNEDYRKSMREIYGRNWRNVINMSAYNQSQVQAARSVERKLHSSTDSGSSISPGVPRTWKPTILPKQS